MLRLRTSLLVALMTAVSASACFGLQPQPAFPVAKTIETGWQLQDIGKVAETGAAISQCSYTPRAWYKATVPGTVLTSLVNDGVYPEPLYGENNRPDKIPDTLCRTAYWYRTTFTVPHSYDHKYVQLNFAGINYIADVWVNGHELGKIDGAFARGTFDISNLVNRAGLNTVAVDILPPPHPGVPLEQTVAAGVGKNGGILAGDGPTFLCTIGWDWIPGIRDRDMGIWQKVYLSAHGPVTVTNTAVSSDLPLPKLDSADLTVRTTLVNVTPEVENGVLIGRFDNNKFELPVTLAANESRDLTLTPLQIPQLHVLNPRLWWPNGFGPQNLHKLNLEFVQNDQISDTINTTFGIRKITYSVPSSPNLTISVNGVPVLCKGGDWGMDEAMKREPYKRLDAQIHMHQLANYTIIRNWVGQSTSDDFYDLCDKYGILLWDETYQPNPFDGDNPFDVDFYMSNVREKFLRFRGHPSIALWCGRNEGYPPPVIDAGIRKLAAQLDPDRLYQPSSTEGRGVHSSGPYYWRAPRIFYTIDAPFKTEIGSVSVPTLESVEGMMPKKDWNVVNDDWAEHDMARGAQGGDWYPATLASRYGTINNLADFDRKAQLANYESFRAMYEGREAKLFAPVTGVITWMSNPAQPSFVWQLYAWDLEPNAALFATRKACEPVHIMLNQSTWHVMVVNNTPGDLLQMNAKVAVYNLDGTLKYVHTDTLTASASATTDDGLIDFPSDLSPVHFVKLTLTNKAGTVISRNIYWRETTQDDFRALNSLPVTAISCHETRSDTGANFRLTVSLKNSSPVPAVMAHLQLRNSRTNRRVLPVYYSDNYITLLPGDSETVRIEGARSDLDGGKPVVFVDGWNVNVKKADGFAPNTDALSVGTANAVPAPSDTVRIDCGGPGTAPFYRFGPPAPDDTDFAADTDFVGGNAKASASSINAAAAESAPPKVYQSERWGPSTYTIPVISGKIYDVRLHFAETTFTAAGARQFNVAINGIQVLTNFDIFAAAGGKLTAVVKDFPGIMPNATGKIVIDFTSGSADQPSIDGIEVLSR